MFSQFIHSFNIQQNHNIYGMKGGFFFCKERITEILKKEKLSNDAHKSAKSCVIKTNECKK